MNRIFAMMCAAVLMSRGMAEGSESVGRDAELPPGHPPLSSSGGAAAGHDGSPLLAGEIVETMNAGNYTYILVKSGDKTMWAAAERFEAVVGQRVVIPRGMVVQNFESPSLGRTFDELYFADGVEVLGAGAADPMPAAHAPHAGEAAPSLEPVAPAEGGVTVAEIHRRRGELAGTTVTVRGRVVKYTERVMGMNWLHIADGSAGGAEGDLTVSSTDSARVGDVVTVKGPVAIDEDLGHGYFYEVMIKGGTVARE